MTITAQICWTSADLDLLPATEGTRYEIIKGELFMTRAPHWRHQEVCGKFFSKLDQWAEVSSLGRVGLAVGILFSESDNVIPDVVWISDQRYSELIDQAGHLSGAPELVIEVLSEGMENQRRDRQAKLKLYSTRGVSEYWLVDWHTQQIEDYCREHNVQDPGQHPMLRLSATLFADDNLTSPLLPNFNCPVRQFF
jgi:Uma2 family endonuclease